jgi:hypothetical protein
MKGYREKRVRQPLENEAMPIVFPALIVWPVQRISRSVGSGLKSQHSADDMSRLHQAFCRLVADSLPVRRSDSTS